MTMDKPILYIFAGLPGSGKTTLSQLLARHIGAAHVRIDTIEQALRELCSVEVQGEGYRLAYRVASDILNAGVSVVADSCNPIELTRREWEQVALDAGAPYVNIEVICSDAREHRTRVETRGSTVQGLRMPTWAEVEHREYHDWTVERIVIDTSRRSEGECLDKLLLACKARLPNRPLKLTVACGACSLAAWSLPNGLIPPQPHVTGIFLLTGMKPTSAVPRTQELLPQARQSDSNQATAGSA